jgi:hypothetical protein
MTSDIRTIIVDALALKLDESPEYLENNYGTHVTTVTEALVERDYEITDRLVEVALGELSYDREAIENLLSSAGLYVRPQPEPTPEEEPVTEGEPAEPGNFEDRVSKLEQGQAQILEAIQGLTNLAQRHLGTSSL